MRIILKNFRVVDEETDTSAALIIENGIITEVLSEIPVEKEDAALIIDGQKFLSNKELPNELPVLMPAFVDLHAHFRDPGLPGFYKNDTSRHGEKSPSIEAPLPAELSLPSEVLESACLAAASGGFGTVVCMANTKPPIDTVKKAAALKRRADALGIVDSYPVLTLTKNMEGRELSEITDIPGENGAYIPLMLSEDGKDLADDGLFIAAMKEAKRLGIPISCHCDFGGDEAEAAKKAGQPRGIWSRIEENNAVRRVIELGAKTGCHIHIAHVSAKEAVETIRQAKAQTGNCGTVPSGTGGFTLTCEAMPHNLCLTEEDAAALGDESWGRVNPPLRSEEDRKALIRAVADGTIDAIATDHAPHSIADKERGVPGFSGFETAFAAVYTELVRNNDGPKISLKRLSSLMSANPARLLGFGDKRGRILPGYRADLVIADTEASWIVRPESFKTRGMNSPFKDHRLFGQILMTIHSGRIVFQK